VRTLHGEGPVLVRPDDPNSIAEGVAFVLDNRDEIRARVAAGKAIALANNAQSYMQAFQELLDEFERKRRCWP